MKTALTSISTGFALFSMFFGSGNLVFPILVGIESSGYLFLASVGIIFTGVLVPFLGVYALKLNDGDYKKFFQPLGKIGTFLICLLCLGLLGPFGVVARCLVVAHGACEIIIPHLSLYLSSLFFCVIIYFLSLNEHKIVSRLGGILTPFLLIAIGVIILFGLKEPMNSINDIGISNPLDVLKTSFLYGYQTMDLMAAFFFASFILLKLKERPSNHSSLFKYAAIIGATLLALVYLGLVLLGWHYQNLLIDSPPQELLGKIALSSLGQLATPCVCIAIILACLTTAIILTSLFANFLKDEILNSKINASQALILTLIIAFFVSTLNFEGISKFLAPILECIYPFMILYTLLNICITIRRRSAAINNSNV